MLSHGMRLRFGLGLNGLNRRASFGPPLRIDPPARVSVAVDVFEMFERCDAMLGIVDDAPEPTDDSSPAYS